MDYKPKAKTKSIELKEKKGEIICHLELSIDVFQRSHTMTKRKYSISRNHEIKKIIHLTPLRLLKSFSKKKVFQKKSFSKSF